MANNSESNENEKAAADPGRRSFLKTAAIAASTVGAASAGSQTAAAKTASANAIPLRVLGKTGVKVPVIHVGTSIDVDTEYDKILHYTWREGAKMYDTAMRYGWGRSHKAMNTFLTQVKDRKSMWITSKTPSSSTEAIRADLDTCLKDIGTDYLDAYFMHGLRKMNMLDKEYLALGDEMRKSGKTRFFGFSCHDGNVVDLMNKAAKVGGIDMILFRYNFRRYGDMDLNRAIDACHKAGIGLMAMKTQGSVPASIEGVKQFTSKNFTLGQAKLKSVWADERIATAVSEMNTVQRAKENITAAKAGAELTAQEVHQLNQLAAQTAHYHCQGCDNICERASNHQLAIADSMRFLMYYESYGKQERARELYQELPEERRLYDEDILHAASKVCPQGIDIVKRYKNANELLA